MEKHDHPTARQRLGDSEAGLGSAATLTVRRRRGDPRHPRRAVRRRGAAPEHPRHRRRRSRWFTRLHGTDRASAADSPRLDVPAAAVSSARASSRRPSRSWCSAASPPSALFGAENPVGREVAIWNQPFRVVGVVTTHELDGARRRRATTSSTRSTSRSRTVHRLLNLAKLNDITITAASTGDVSRVMGDVTKLLRVRHGSATTSRTISPSRRRRVRRWRRAACARTSPAPSSATWPDWRR